MLAYEREIFNNLESPIDSLGESYRRLTKKFPLIPIRSKAHHQAACDLIVKLTLLENAGEIPKKDQEGIQHFLATLGLIVADYEKDHYPTDTSHLTPVDMLKFFMEQHHLSQSDLAEDLGGQGNVSKVLKGERPLSLKAIKALSKRFGVNAEVFM